MCLSKIREFFWPLLESENIHEEVNIIDSKSILIKNKDNLKIALDLSLKNYDSENERKKSVESKSIIFIGLISLITTIIITIIKDYFLKDDFKFDVNSILFITIIVIYTVYLARTLWFSVKCLERKAYHTINFQLYNQSDDEYIKYLIAEIATIIAKNYKVINGKVDYMVMSQEYFKRAIIILVIYPFLYVAITLLQKYYVFCNY